MFNITKNTTYFDLLHNTLKKNVIAISYLVPIHIVYFIN